MNKTGVQIEHFPHSRNYDYEVVCGITHTEFPIEYEIPRENTGFLRNQKFDDCVANVLAQLSEAFWNKELNTNEKHSEQFIYGGLRNEYSTSPGMLVSTTMELWNQIGVVPQKYFNVPGEMPELKKIVAKFPELFDIAKKYRISGFVQIKSTGKSNKDLQIKDALMTTQRGLVVVSPKGFSGGSHCIMLTGWNDNNNKYKFKNSWGEKYGDKGFSEIDKSKISEVYMPIFQPIKLGFKDVSKDDWFYDDVKHVHFSGVMQGTSSETFEPLRPVIRAELSAVVNRILKIMDERFDVLDRVLAEKDELKS